MIENKSGVFSGSKSTITFPRIEIKEEQKNKHQQEQQQIEKLKLHLEWCNMMVTQMNWKISQQFLHILRLV